MQTPVKSIPLLAGLVLFASGLFSANPPSERLSNGQITAKLYLPDQNNGFYRSTRFDWSGVITSLEYKGHDFYGPWFQRIDPAVYDFNYDDQGVVSAPFTAMVGPGEEFNTDGTALGWADAKPGGTFVKIGVGVLRKPDETKYDHSKTYEIVDPGKWTVTKHRDSIDFTHELSDPLSGYGYVYKKTVRLVSGKPEMILEHSLKNTEKNPIKSTVYNHNFLVLDKQPPSPDVSITFPFEIQSPRPPRKELAEIRGKQIVYVKTLEDKDRATTVVRGFGDTAKDYDIRVENTRVGVGFRVTGDRPLSNVALWSIRTVLAVEPYIAMSIEPGGDFSWKLTYDYYTLRSNTK
jgi:hypothetical protein